MPDPMPASASMAVAHLPALTTNDLCTTIDGEPRISDRRLGKLLGFANARDVRNIIRRNRGELDAHGSVVEAGVLVQPAPKPCPSVTTTGVLRQPDAKPLGGRPRKDFWLNEGQALTVCLLARTSTAATIRREVITVFMAYRRGLIDQPHVTPAKLQSLIERLNYLESALEETLRMALPLTERDRSHWLRDSRGCMVIRTAKSIGDYLGIAASKVKEMHRLGMLETWSMHRVLYAYRDSLDRLIWQRELSELLRGKSTLIGQQSALLNAIE